MANINIGGRLHSTATGNTVAGANEILDDSKGKKQSVINQETDEALAGKQATIDDLSAIRSGAAAGATAYQKPSGGVPASDMASGVQTSLGKADTAYQKPGAGVPKTDLESGVQASLELADSAIQARPQGEITPVVVPADYATREELGELEAKVGDISTGKYYGYFAKEEDLPEADVDGFAYVGEGPTYTIYNLRGGVWTSSDITVNQSPIGNDEDIDQNEDGKLQFANRVYNAQQPNGMGYKILRKDSTFAAQVSETNTIFEIRHDFDLGGSSRTLPANSVLKFNGGKLTNGSLRGNNSSIEGDIDGVFSFLLEGTWKTPFNPRMWGIGSVAEDNYKALYRTFESAKRCNMRVVFNGIDTINIALPSSFYSIPLTDRTDFGGITINILNTVEEKVLFRLERQTTGDVVVAKNLLEKSNIDFSSVATINTGTKLLIVKDDNFWTKRYGTDNFYRKDVLLLNNGQAMAGVIQTYNNNYSSPSCSYVDAEPEEKFVKNLKIVRNASSTYKTNVFSFSGLFNVKLENVSVETNNANNLSNDRVAVFVNCYGVRIKDYCVFGLYDYSGSAYGLSFQNCSDVVIDTFRSRNDNWGIIGSDCLQNVVLLNSSINRFDIHCYGANISAKNCSFKKMYNSFEGCYGRLVFEDCKYYDSTPILYGSGSYNAWTPVDIIFKRCDFYLNYSTKNYLIDLALSTQVADNARNELSTKCLPNVYVEKCTLNNVGGNNGLTLFKNVVAQTSAFKYITELWFKDTKANGVNNFYLNNDGDIETAKKLHIRFDGFILPPDSFAENSDTHLAVIHHIHPSGFGTCEIVDSKMGVYVDGFVYYKISGLRSIIHALYRKGSMLPCCFRDCDIYMSDSWNANYYELPSNSEFYSCKFTLTKANKYIQQTYPGTVLFENCTKADNSAAYLDGGLANMYELKYTRIFNPDSGANLGTKYLYEYIHQSGPTARRPAMNSNYFCLYYDIDLGKMILGRGTTWTNVDGTALA